MVTWFGSLGLFIVFRLHVTLDRRIWGTSVTPGVLIIGGYAAVAFVQAVASLAYEMGELRIATYVFLCGFGVLSMGLSFLTCSALSWKRREYKSKVFGSRGLLRAFVLVISFAYGMAAYILAKNSGGLWSSESMSSLSGGGIGHLHVVLSILAVWYAVDTNDRALSRYIVLAFSLVALSFYPVKGWTLIPMVAIALAQLRRNTGQNRAFWPIILSVGIVGVLLFFGIYSARADLETVTSADLFVALIEPITVHFLFYLTAGLSGLNAVLGGLQLHGGFEVLFAPIVNVVALMTGDNYVNVISDTYVPSLVEQSTSGNVYSMLGTLIAYSGPIVGICLAALIVSSSYVFTAWCLRSRSSVLSAAALYVNAMLAFSWFEYYLWHLTVYEVVMISLFIYLLKVMLVSNSKGYRSLNFEVRG